MKKVFIWGASGQGRVILNILREGKKFKVFGFIDNNPKLWGKKVDGIKVLGRENKLASLKKRGIKLGFVGIGDNKIRRKISHYLRNQGFSLINAIHPAAIISKTAIIGNGTAIMAGAIINTDAKIGDDVIINTGAIIEHDNIIENGVHIAPGVRLAGGVTIKKGTFVGIGSTVIQYKKIGKNSIIGAGAVVLKNLPDNVLAVGIPAKIIKNFKKNKK